MGRFNDKFLWGGWYLVGRGGGILHREWRLQEAISPSYRPQAPSPPRRICDPKQTTPSTEIEAVSLMAQALELLCTLDAWGLELIASSLA